MWKDAWKADNTHQILHQERKKKIHEHPWNLLKPFPDRQIAHLIGSHDYGPHIVLRNNDHDAQNTKYSRYFFGNTIPVYRVLAGVRKLVYSPIGGPTVMTQTSYGENIGRIKLT